MTVVLVMKCFSERLRSTKHRPNNKIEVCFSIIVDSIVFSSWIVTKFVLFVLVL